MVLNDLIAANAESFPRKPALVCGKKITSYQQLGKEIISLASGLMSLDIKVGDRIALLMRNRPEFVTIFFAILRVGGIPVPLNYLWKEEELSFVLSDSGAVLLFTEKEFVEIGKNLQRRLERMNNVVLVDGAQTVSEGIIAYRDLLRSAPTRPFPITAGTDIACLIYTSGTTGFPKGVMLTHENLLANVESCRQAVSLSSRDRFLCVLPMFHTFSFTVCVLIPLSLGCTIFIVPKLELGQFRRLMYDILKWRITIFVAIPDLYQILSEIRIAFFAQIALRFFNPVRLAISGAAALPPEVLKSFEARFGIPLLEGYGLTETAPVVTLNPPGRSKAGSIGVPIPGVEVKVVSEEGEELPPGQVGEIVVKGKNVMFGYYHRPEETREVLKDGWLFTGDLAKKDEDGYLFLVDRKKEMINFKGLNIYPREVENAIYQHPAIKEAAVIGEPVPVGEVPVAYVVLKEGNQITAKELLDFLRLRLATYKLPRRIIFREELPHTATGKISKKELKKQAWDEKTGKVFRSSS